MEKTILKTSSDNWIVSFRRICKSQKSILLINDSSLRNEDMFEIVSNSLKYFTLSSKQLILRNILLVLIPVIGLFLTIMSVYGIYTVISINARLFNIISSIFVFIISSFFTFYATNKLIKAKKPNISRIENKITIDWNKYSSLKKKSLDEKINLKKDN